ncbi:phage holin family protein [Ornithinimicrobium cryptoxanthini]|uniref:Phage holin family protein n=1 Tax=Ornithinimicrobium cryptoxanthini TaxID=2934161 RepID=A0ABY4YMY8_9MICO|nr:phage holin family protein [Ornithinimicrobium cryptoxanthini]USQ77850.1 phage holin family protein [Ornithinimicrobium cryptoxanthini]
MIRFLATSLLYLMGNALGLLVAAWLLPGFHLAPLGFLISVLFLSLVEILLGPFVFKMAVSYVPALRGGIALVTTFIGLLLTTIFTNGVRIEGVLTWVLAPFVVWIVVLLAAVLLPLVLFKKVLAGRRGESASAAQP